MNHDYIEQSDLVGRYLRGVVSIEERERFEEHFIDCPQCIDLFKTMRDFKQGLQLLTVQQLSQKEVYSEKGLRWRFLERFSWKRLTFAAGACCLLLAAIIGSTLLALQARHLRQEVGYAKSDSLEWQRRYEEQQQATLSSEQQRQEMERNLSGQVAQLEEELQNEQRQHADQADTPQGWMQPGINLTNFVLNSVRGNGQNTSDGLNEINLPRSPMNFTMSVHLEDETKYKTYRVTILADQRPYWRKTGYNPDRYNSLLLGFNSSFFRPSDYLLTVEGAFSGRAYTIIGNYPFRVIKHP